MSETRVACYVYGVVPVGGPLPLEGLAGVDSAFEVGDVTQGGLSAVVSRVSLCEFGAEPLRRNLEDLTWVARTARLHDAVLARVLDTAAVVPFRLCTIFADEAGVRDALERTQASLLDALGRVRGRAEWSVKGLADAVVVNAAVLGREIAGTGAENESSGRAFFARKRRERALWSEARAIVERAVEETHAGLCTQAAAATLLRPQDHRLSGRSGEMVLNGAYLVERSNAKAFAATVRELDADHRDIGLALELSGPFAPYTFVPTAEQPT